MILGLCERFSVLPSQLLAEDCSLLALIAIEDLGRDRDREDPEGG